jgi:hypothetical protein
MYFLSDMQQSQMAWRPLTTHPLTNIPDPDLHYWKQHHHHGKIYPLLLPVVKADSRCKLLFNAADLKCLLKDTANQCTVKHLSPTWQ